MARIKPGYDYMTTGFPSMGGFPAVPPERIRVLHRARGLKGYWVVRYASDGGTIAMPEERIGSRARVASARGLRR